jgi:hypothetical protein
LIKSVLILLPRRKKGILCCLRVAQTSGSHHGREFTWSYLLRGGKSHWKERKRWSSWSRIGAQAHGFPGR